jgi:predicted ester cyclase
MNTNASVDANIEVIRSYLSRVDGGDFDALREVSTPGLVVHFPGADLSLDEAEETLRTFYSAFPDFTHTVDDIFGVGDRVVLRATDRGIHSGEFMGIAPTGKRIEIGVLAIFRFQGDGLIDEVWEEADLLGLLRQLGVPLPG